MRWEIQADGPSVACGVADLPDGAPQVGVTQGAEGRRRTQERLRLSVYRSPRNGATSGPVMPKIT
jgi:hypothetical protein